MKGSVETSVGGRERRAALVAAGLGVLLVAATVAVGLRLRALGVPLYLGGPLLAGQWDPRLPPAVVLPLLVAAIVVALAPRAAGVRWPALLGGSAFGVAAWAVALALVDGTSGLLRGIDNEHDYLHDVPRVGALGDLLPDYVARVPLAAPDNWTTHVSGHPPGTLLLLTVLDRIGLGGPGWTAAVFVTAGALAVPAVLVTTRAVAGEAIARSAAPYLVLTPMAVWLATSADGLFLGVGAWGVAALATAATAVGARAAVRAVVGGLLLGAALFLSYGLSLLAPVVLAAAWASGERAGRAPAERVRLIALGAAGVVAVVLGFLAAGFWWLSGLFATMDRVAEGAAAIQRPAAFFLVANLAAAAVAIGPAGVAGLGSALAGLRHRAGRSAAVVLPLAALAAVLLADLSLLSKGEVERIYLPFYGWMLVATALLAVRRRRSWLVAQAGTALAVQLLVRTWW